VSDQARRILAWTGAALSLACIPAALAVIVAGNLGMTRALSIAPAACLTFTVVGAIVASGAPRNAVGWLLLGVGATMGVGLVTSSLNAWDDRHTGTVTGAPLIALVDGALWLMTLGFLLPRLMLLFPDGRPPSRRWRIVGWGQWAFLVGLSLTLLKPGPIHDYERYDNPIGIGPLDVIDRAPAAVGGALGGAFIALELAAVASVLVRFRHSSGVERLQMKWVAWAIGVTASLWVVGPLLVTLTGSHPLGHVIEIMGLIGLVLCPVAIGVAVQRYRLYEIDRLISRTLVYGVLSLVLGAAYVGLVLLGQAASSSIAGGSNLAIAVSTLVVAALFLPVRSRVQRFVDRRFYRRRYDAQRTLEGFGARLREEIDLGNLQADLRAVVSETMQPAHTSIWLPEGQP
jgi:hypothetical protein